MAQEGRDEKGKFPTSEKVIDRMLLKYPDTIIEMTTIDLKVEEDRTIKELEKIWNGEKERNKS